MADNDRSLLVTSKQPVASIHLTYPSEYRPPNGRRRFFLVLYVTMATNVPRRKIPRDYYASRLRDEQESVM